MAAANVTGRDEGCEGGDGGSEGRGGLGEVKAGAELAAVAEVLKQASLQLQELLIPVVVVAVQMTALLEQAVLASLLFLIQIQMMI